MKTLNILRIADVLICGMSFGLIVAFGRWELGLLAILLCFWNFIYGYWRGKNNE